MTLKQDCKKLADVVHVLETTQNLVISRCLFAEDGKEMYKNARAQLLFCSLNLLFSYVRVAVAVVVKFPTLARTTYLSLMICPRKA